MGSRTAAALERLLAEASGGTEPPDEKFLLRVAGELGRGFGVRADEVALLELAPSGKSLVFVIPPRLRPVGTIPLTSTAALAARTARERRAEIVNNFASARHAAVFEAVPVGDRPAQSIHKIMSAPLLENGRLMGVAQISRKGPSASDAGEDFTPRDLRDLRELNDVLCRLLALLRAA